MPRSESTAPAPARFDVPAAPGTLPASLFIDAGVAHLRLLARDDRGRTRSDLLLPSSADLPSVLHAHGFDVALATGRLPLLVTGELRHDGLRQAPGRQDLFPAAASWLTARDLLRSEDDPRVRALATIELSASGYAVVGVERSGGLRNRLLTVNSRCGAGSGVNLDRVLEKLGLSRDDVDRLLAPWSGDAGRARRTAIPIRADRCGVFASSATVSDKNQGIPLDVALATTLKSEVLKACRKLPPGFDRVWPHRPRVLLALRPGLRGRLPRGAGRRRDRLRPGQQPACSTRCFRFVDRVGYARDHAAGPPPAAAVPARGVPAFDELKARYAADHRYLRLPVGAARRGRRRRSPAGRSSSASTSGRRWPRPCSPTPRAAKSLSSPRYSNAGDTIETAEEASFATWCAPGSRGHRCVASASPARRATRCSRRWRASIPQPPAGSPSWWRTTRTRAGRSTRRGATCARLSERGVAVNQISASSWTSAARTPRSRRSRSPGRTLRQRDEPEVLRGHRQPDGHAVRRSSASPASPRRAPRPTAAPRSFSINATCAVFLMENARRLQAQGVPRDQILASANWAIVENMARTPGTRLEMPRDVVVLLHGQTMLSEPLPLAVTDRLEAYLDAPVYALVPPHPGHRACFGLLRTLERRRCPRAAEIDLTEFVEAEFEKRIIECRGAACDDDAARCSRTVAPLPRRRRRALSFTLGGCAPINELFARRDATRRRRRATPTGRSGTSSRRASRGPTTRAGSSSRAASASPNGPTSSRGPSSASTCRCTSTTSARADLLTGQGLFNIDTCAPQTGAVGQCHRLAGEPHGIILRAADRDPARRRARAGDDVHGQPGRPRRWRKTSPLSRIPARASTCSA